jgi:hypothetical protein
MNIGLFTQRNNQIHNYKPRNNLQIKTKLGNTVCFVTVTRCLGDRLRAISFSLQSLLQHSPTWRAVSACVPRRQKADFNIFCEPIISTFAKVCTWQVSFSSVNYCVIINSSSASSESPCIIQHAYLSSVTAEFSSMWL